LITPLRADLPALPERMKRLSVDHRGFPVPWFVQWDEVSDRPLAHGMHLR
jgi:hypothetical protein